MSQNLPKFAKFKKFQLENLVDFEKCCKTHIFLQKSEPIQPKTSNILPKFCQPTPRTRPRRPPGGAAPRAPPTRRLARRPLQRTWAGRLKNVRLEEEGKARAGKHFQPADPLFSSNVPANYLRFQRYSQQFTGLLQPQRHSLQNICNSTLGYDTKRAGCEKCYNR